MSSVKDKRNVGRLGTYYVAYELERRGVTATIRSDTATGSDIVALSPNGSRSCVIEVKTTLTTKPAFESGGEISITFLPGLETDGYDANRDEIRRRVAANSQKFFAIVYTDENRNVLGIRVAPSEAVKRGILEWYDDYVGGRFIDHPRLAKSGLKKGKPIKATGPQQWSLPRKYNDRFDSIKTALGVHR